MYTTDIEGKWLEKEGYRVLIEPSVSYTNQREAERLEREQQDIIDSLSPTNDELLKAETEVQILELLMEVGLL